MSQKIFLLTFEGSCVNFSLEFIFFILNHPVTSKQPPRIVQIHMPHPVFEAVWTWYLLFPISSL